MKEEQALKEIKKLALSGHSEPCFFLGKYFSDYSHLDEKEAHKWFKLGAGLGHELCQVYCGHDFEVGEGCEKDLKLAEYYYDLAAKQGNEMARLASLKFKI